MTTSALTASPRVDWTARIRKGYRVEDATPQALDHFTPSVPQLTQPAPPVRRGKTLLKGALLCASVAAAAATAVTAGPAVAATLSALPLAVKIGAGLGAACLAPCGLLGAMAGDAPGREWMALPGIAAGVALFGSAGMAVGGGLGLAAHALLGALL